MRFLQSLVSLQRVSMGLTLSHKTAKNLAVMRKNERILTVSRKKKPRVDDQCNVVYKIPCGSCP